MLELESVTVRFDGQKVALAPSSLRLCPGERSFVCGAAGSGKSTLLAVAAGIVPRLIRPAWFAGMARLDGVTHELPPTSELVTKIGCVLQTLDEQLWDQTVEDLIAFPLENRGHPQGDLRRRLAGMCELFDLAPLLGRKVPTLSGGERRLAALAAALAGEPRLLVLDEPTTGLDPAARQRLVAALERAAGRIPMLLVAEQTAAPFEQLGGRVHFQKAGALVESLPMAQALARPDPWQKVGLLPPRPEARRPRPAVRPIDGRLRLEGLTSRLRRADGTPVLHDIAFALGRGEVVGVVGPNGTGKTTLFKLLLGLEHAATGSIRLDGEAIDGWTVARRARRIAWLPQNVRQMLFHLTVLDEILFALAGGPPGGHRVELQGEARRLLQVFGLADRAESSPFALTPRQQTILGLACLAAGDPALLILDEPLIARDAAGRALLSDFLEAATADGRTVLLASHDLELVDAVSDRLLILVGGAIGYLGETGAGWRSPAFGQLGWPAPERTAPALA